MEAIDNGGGMDKEMFIHYHNLTSPKKRGEGIGFVGQGAKLALTFCSKVLTQTQCKSYKGYSEWQLKGDGGPYKIHHNEILDLKHQGTKATLYLRRDAMSFYTKKRIEEILEEHYYPLLDKRLLEIYSGKVPLLKNKRQALKHYYPLHPKGVKFFINGKEVIKKSLQDTVRNMKQVSITIYKRPKARGFLD